MYAWTTAGLINKTDLLGIRHALYGVYAMASKAQSTSPTASQPQLGMR